MRRLIATCLACAATSGGCGGGDEEPARTVELRRDEPIRLTAREYSFDPGRVIVAGGGGDLRFTLDNRGDLAHNVTVFEDERELGGMTSFPGGERRSVTVAVPPGRYQLVCTVGDHRELGMEAELEVSR